MNALKCKQLVGTDLILSAYHIQYQSFQIGIVWCRFDWINSLSVVADHVVSLTLCMATSYIELTMMRTETCNYANVYFFVWFPTGYGRKVVDFMPYTPTDVVLSMNIIILAFTSAPFTSFCLCFAATCFAVVRMCLSNAHLFVHLWNLWLLLRHARMLWHCERTHTHEREPSPLSEWHLMRTLTSIVVDDVCSHLHGLRFSVKTYVMPPFRNK